MWANARKILIFGEPFFDELRRFWPPIDSIPKTAPTRQVNLGISLKSFGSVACLPDSSVSSLEPVGYTHVKRAFRLAKPNRVRHARVHAAAWREDYNGYRRNRRNTV